MKRIIQRVYGKIFKKLIKAKSTLEEVEKTYNNALSLNVNAQSYEVTIQGLTTDYPEYNTVVIRLRNGETPGTTPGTTPGGNSGTTHNATDGYMSAVADKKLTSSKAEGWNKKDGQWLYQLEDGSHIINEWKQINGTWYRFDNSGLMQTGWAKENGTWYYLNDSGAMQTGWVKENGTWYYLNDSGAMQTGWIKENGTWYYLNKSGAMQTGWLNDNDKWYYLDQTGALAISITTPDGYTVNADGEWVE